MIKVHFILCIINWHVHNYVSRQGEGRNRINESININIQFCSLWYHTHFLKPITACSRWNYSLIIRDIRFCYEIRTPMQSSKRQNFSPSVMATLKNRRKLAAVSRETTEYTRNSQSQNTLDPETCQEYIYQVSEEIEGWVIKKISKEFSRMESGIFGALSKLDQFLLNPRARTCSVAVPETSRSNDSENRQPTGDRSLAIPVLKRCSVLITLVP